jgi:hypothetical protein
MTTDPQAPAATAPAASIDAPRVPRLPMLSGRAIGLAVIGAAVLVGYAAIAYTDYEPGSPAREAIPASVRSSPGGYRSFHFWHSGYHGGK